MLSNAISYVSKELQGKELTQPQPNQCRCLQTLQSRQVACLDRRSAQRHSLTIFHLGKLDNDQQWPDRRMKRKLTPVLEQDHGGVHSEPV